MAESWLIHAEAAQTPKNTVTAVKRGVGYFLDWCDQQDVPPDLHAPESVVRWMATLAARGLTGKTANSYLNALRAYARWLVEEGEMKASGPAQVKLAAQNTRVPPALTTDQKAKIIAACDADKGFYGIRDAAIFTMMFDTMARADETVSMTTRDVNIRDRVARVRNGKGSRERLTGFSAEAARRLDRYQRHRRSHRYAELDSYWVGQRGALAYKGLYSALKRRCREAGIDAHPHMLRRGGAVEWRLKGGSVESLMTLAGWRNPAMVMHYTRSADFTIALAEAKRIHDS